LNEFDDLFEFVEDIFEQPADAEGAVERISALPSSD